jgi:hypothetical protein
MKTPFLDLLIEEHQNHIESVEVSSYYGIPETRKQLAELEAIKAIIVTHCCESDSEQLVCGCGKNKPIRREPAYLHCDWCGSITVETK